MSCLDAPISERHGRTYQIISSERLLSEAVWSLRLCLENPSHLQSSILNLEDRRAPHLRSSVPKNGSKIGRKTRGWGTCATSSKMEDGVLRRRWGSSIFRLRRTKNPPSFFVGPNNEESPNLPLSLPEERRTPSGTSSSTPALDQWLPAPLSYPKIWMFRPIFHLEDRSEDRDRPSTRKSYVRKPMGKRNPRLTTS